MGKIYIGDGSRTTQMDLSFHSGFKFLFLMATWWSPFHDYEYVPSLEIRKQNGYEFLRHNPDCDDPFESEFRILVLMTNFDSEFRVVITERIQVIRIVTGNFTVHCKSVDCWSFWQWIPDCDGNFGKLIPDYDGHFDGLLQIVKVIYDSEFWIVKAMCNLAGLLVLFEVVFRLLLIIYKVVFSLTTDHF